ncbi:hypothetical protein [Pedobacter arcticus]|uniref:hypothetical protein n=1 Tax=Pedobacter arcticus TaxID=752140 RepID=UPI00030913B6|nr:hypothetical protein [Pedobacter arcticus]
MKILQVTKEKQWTDWKEVYIFDDEYFNEPMIDQNKWDNEQILPYRINQMYLPEYLLLLK